MSRLMGHFLAFLFVVLLPPWSTSEAQTTQAFAEPAVDDINLYYGALRFVRAVHLDSLKAGKPGETATIQMALRKELGVNEADYAALVREAVALESRDGAVQSQAGANTSTSATVAGSGQASLAGVPATTGLQLGAADRLVLANQAVQRLRVGLSPDGWAKFRAFVNGPFRRATFVLRGPASNSGGAGK